jgi:hypothetical protein
MAPMFDLGTDRHRYSRSLGGASASRCHPSADRKPPRPADHGDRAARTVPTLTLFWHQSGSDGLWHQCSTLAQIGTDVRHQFWSSQLAEHRGVAAHTGIAAMAFAPLGRLAVLLRCSVRTWVRPCWFMRRDMHSPRITSLYVAGSVCCWVHHTDLKGLVWAVTPH